MVITDVWLCTVQVWLYSAETFEPLLSSTVQISKSEAYSFLHPWLGRGLLTGDGERWRRHRYIHLALSSSDSGITRKLLTPAFHFSILEEFLPVMEVHTRTLLEKLAAHAGNTIDIYKPGRF